MISSLRGRVLTATGNSVVIEVGGVGLAREHHARARARQPHSGEEITVHTSLIVREDALSLFGFATRDELDVFELLIGVTGVGPKSALGVLSALSPEQIAAAVAARRRRPVPQGVAASARRPRSSSSSQLAGKLVATTSPAGARRRRHGRRRREVLAALIGLGWSERVAAEAVDETDGRRHPTVERGIRARAAAPDPRRARARAAAGRTR